MEVIHPRRAGIDVSKKDAKVCVRVQGRGRRGTSTTATTWGSTTAEILALGEHLLDQQVSCVVIESTSDYWKPFYYLLEEHLPVMLVNAKAARNVPGRKTGSRMRRGCWLIWAPMGWCGPRLCPGPDPGAAGSDPRAPSSPGPAPRRFSGWRSCSKTPGSNSQRWRPTSSGSPGGRCWRR